MYGYKIKKRRDMSNFKGEDNPPEKEPEKIPEIPVDPDKRDPDKIDPEIGDPKIEDPKMNDKRK